MIAKAIRYVNKWLFILVFILLASYFILVGYFGGLISLPIFIEIKSAYIKSLSISFLILLLTLLISKQKAMIKISLLIPAIFFFTSFSFLWISYPERILASTNLEDRRYHISAQGAVDDMGVRIVYTAYKCNENDLNCEKIYSEIYNALVDVSLLINRETNEVYVLRDGNPQFMDGSPQREILASAYHNGFVFYVSIHAVDVYPIYGDADEQYSYMLYKCKSSFSACERLPFGYLDNGGSFVLIFNEDSGELEMYQWKSDTGRVLIYSYGAEPKCYVEKCVNLDE